LEGGKHSIGDSPAGLVLLVQYIHQVHQFVCLPKAREKMFFFQFLVVVLNEFPDDVGRIDYGLRRKVLLGVNAPDHFVIDQKHAFQDSVLAHQVFVG